MRAKPHIQCRKNQEGPECCVLGALFLPIGIAYVVLHQPIAIDKHPDRR